MYCVLAGDEYLVADQLGGMLNFWPDKWRGSTWQRLPADLHMMGAY